jgi:hypothetical protein
MVAVVMGLGLLSTACATQVSGTAAPATSPIVHDLPGGAVLSCLTNCDDDVDRGDTNASALPPVGSLPGGFLCRDLADLGYGPADAVDYWYLWAEPDQMDADLNGIPCETVWPGMDRYLPG